MALSTSQLTEVDPNRIRQWCRKMLLDRGTGNRGCAEQVMQKFLDFSVVKKLLHALTSCMLPFVSAPPFLHLSLSPTDFSRGSYTTARVFSNSTQPLLLEQSYLSNTKYTVRRANRPIACLVWREVQPCLEA